MAKIEPNINIVAPKTPITHHTGKGSTQSPDTEQVHPRMLIGAWQRMANVVNGQLSFGDGTKSDNIQGSWVTVTTPATPNTNFTVSHNLGYVPVAFDVKNKNASCDIYQGSLASTKTTMTLKCTVASVQVLLFIH